MKIADKNNFYSYLLISLTSLVVLIAGYVFFDHILPMRDLCDHRQILIRSIENHVILSNFLYYLIVYIVALFTIENLAYSIPLVLSFSICAKYIISCHYARHFEIKNQYYLLALVSLIIYHPILFSFNTDQNLYLGKFPGNVWHNSTTIFLFPFAIALFFESFNQLKSTEKDRTLVLSVLVILNIVIKPSYFFVFAVVFPLLSLLENGRNKYFYRSLIPVGIGCLIICLQFYYIYVNPSVSEILDNGEKSSVVIRPFKVWQFFTKNRAIDLIQSIALPLLYFIFYPQRLKNKLNQYVVFSWMVALAIFVMLAETGPRMMHGNFIWQVYICTYLLFLVLYIDFFKQKQLQQASKWKNYVIMGVFSYQVFCGVMYIYRIAKYLQYN